MLLDPLPASHPPMPENRFRHGRWTMPNNVLTEVPPVGLKRKRDPPREADHCCVNAFIPDIEEQ